MFDLPIYFIFFIFSFSFFFIDCFYLLYLYLYFIESFVSNTSFIVYVLQNSKECLNYFRIGFFVFFNSDSYLSASTFVLFVLLSIISVYISVDISDQFCFSHFYFIFDFNFNFNRHKIHFALNCTISQFLIILSISNHSLYDNRKHWVLHLLRNILWNDFIKIKNIFIY